MKDLIFITPASPRDIGFSVRYTPVEKGWMEVSGVLRWNEAVVGDRDDSTNMQKHKFGGGKQAEGIVSREKRNSNALEIQHWNHNMSVVSLRFAHLGIALVETSLTFV